MSFHQFKNIDYAQLPSPCFVVNECAVEQNLKVLNQVAQKSGAKILHALKAFSMYSLAPLTNQYLSGTCSSGLHEALLAKNFYKPNDSQEIHVYSAGFSESDLVELLSFANHIVFNSPSQLIRFSDMCFEYQKKRPQLHFGLRINPQHSEGEFTLYDPCAPCSRLGTTKELLSQFMGQADFDKAFKLISGLHFHTLCEQDFYPLKRTVDTVISQFGEFLPQMKWLNFGGGHHITAVDYQQDKLVELIRSVSQKYGVQVYLEPGEAVAINTGVLVAEVLDITNNGLPIAILDTSATCHMPDTLEMPYRANIIDAGKPNEKPYTYRLGGLTCLAGDVIGDYSFDKPLVVGQKIIFEDMTHYTMVKTSTFNGTNLPAIVNWNSQTNQTKVVKTFGYNNFISRL